MTTARGFFGFSREERESGEDARREDAAMAEKIEAIAKALWNNERDNPRNPFWAPWGLLDHDDKELYREKARTALSASNNQEGGK